MDMAFRGYVPPVPRMVPRSRFLAVSLGLLQRTDDDVSSGAGIVYASAATGSMDRMEAHHLRIRWTALHWLLRSPFCPSVFARLVRSQRQAGQVRRLFPKLRDGHGSPPPVLH